MWGHKRRQSSESLSGPLPNRESVVVVVQLLSHIQLFATPQREFTWILIIDFPVFRTMWSECLLFKLWGCGIFHCSSPDRQRQVYVCLFSFNRCRLTHIITQLVLFSVKNIERVLNLSNTFPVFTEMIRECCCCSVTKSCLTLCHPMDCSLPGSSAHEIFQARILEWFAISYFRGSSWPRDWPCISWGSCIGKWFVYY